MDIRPGTATRTDITGRRLGILMAGYLLLIVGTITLAPFRFVRPEYPIMSLMILDDGWISDVLLNIVLFLPIGFILRRAMHQGDRFALRVLFVGAVMSTTIEITQFFIPGRYSTVSDIVSNALGAWLGARISDALSTHVGEDRALVGRLRLDVPLMGIVYLLLPLLWLGGLAAHGPEAIWPILPLGLGGAFVLSAVSEQSAGTCAITAFSWYAIAAVPLLRTSPESAAISIIVVATAAWLGRHFWEWTLHRDRRLEPQVVRLLLPLLVLHLLLVGFTPNALGLQGGADSARVAILGWIGRMAAFTMWGYLLAEARGRRREAWRIMMLIPVTSALALALLLGAMARGPADGITILAGAITAGLGATLYHFQRAHILTLLGIE